MLKLDVTEQPIPPSNQTSSVGFALTEAPRGLLYHAYKLDSNGIVQKADLVPPTTHNSGSIESSLLDSCQKSSKRTKTYSWSVKN